MYHWSSVSCPLEVNIKVFSPSRLLFHPVAFIALLILLTTSGHDKTFPSEASVTLLLELFNISMTLSAAAFNALSYPISSASSPDLPKNDLSILLATSNITFFSSG